MKIQEKQKNPMIQKPSENKKKQSHKLILKKKFTNKLLEEEGKLELKKKNYEDLLLNRPVCKEKFSIKEKETIKKETKQISNN